MSDKYLIEAGLAENSGQATQVFSMLQPSFDSIKASPSMYIRDIWEKFEALDGVNNNLRGSVFELLIGSIFLVNGLQPLYRQAEVTYVNNARFDYLLWENALRPISISVKTSLRERYKQADLEAWALKSVHKGAENYLVTLSQGEIATRQRKIEDGTEFSSLDSMYLATDPKFDGFVEYLKGLDFGSPQNVNPMASKYVAKV